MGQKINVQLLIVLSISNSHCDKYRQLNNSKNRRFQLKNRKVLNTYCVIWYSGEKVKTC